VVGMPGVGKSELALYYAHSYGQSYPGGICWVDAQEEDIAIQIVQFAQRLGLVPPEDDESNNQLRYCWQNWPDAPKPVLTRISHQL
jgi:predicted ATP-dependent serine protease